MLSLHFSLVPSVNKSVKWLIHNGSYMGAHVLLNLLNELRKRNAMRGLINSIIQDHGC